MSEKRIIYDDLTRNWFKLHPGAETTVVQCKKCGLYYKPSLGHGRRCDPQDKKKVGAK